MVNNYALYGIRIFAVILFVSIFLSAQHLVSPTVCAILVSIPIFGVLWHFESEFKRSSQRNYSRRKAMLGTALAICFSILLLIAWSFIYNAGIFFVNSVRYLQSDSFANGYFPIKGIGALDQTSIAEYILYGVVFLSLAAIFSFAMRLLNYPAKPYEKLLCALPFAVSIIAGAACIFSSTIMLFAYIDINGLTSARAAGIAYVIICAIWAILLARDAFYLVLCKTKNA